MSRSAKILRVLAVVWAAAAVLLSEWGLEQLLGTQMTDKARVPFAALTALLAGLAALTWFGADRPLVARLNVSAVALFLVGPVLAEIGLRASFLIEGSPTRSPIRYAHNLLDDDYWILAGRWNTPYERIEPRRVHSKLGWSQAPPTEKNPHGLQKPTREKMVRDGRRKVLFYGDSYVAGISERENWIPVYADDRLEETDVVHLGVGGYGTGQAYLLMEETISLVDDPFVLQGIMVFDLDRATRLVRSYQKPRYRVRGDGTLELTNVPVEPDPDVFFANARLSFRSFVLAALNERFLPLDDPAFPEKLEVNRALLAANQAVANEKGSGLMVVLFHPLSDLLEEDYRSTFFVEEMERLGIPYLDTRGPLLDHVRETGIDPGLLYVGGHHNDLGNQVIGDALVARLRELGFR